MAEQQVVLEVRAVAVAIFQEVADLERQAKAMLEERLLLLGLVVTPEEGAVQEQ